MDLNRYVFAARITGKSIAYWEARPQTGSYFFYKRWVSSWGGPNQQLVLMDRSVLHQIRANIKELNIKETSTVGEINKELESIGVKVVSEEQAQKLMAMI